MSTTISISLYEKPENVPKLLGALLRSLEERSIPRGIELHEGFYLQNVQRIEVRNSAHIEELMWENKDSNKMLNFNMSYQLLSNRKVGIDLKVPGCKFNNGHNYAENGPITISLSLNDISRPLKDLIRQPNHRFDEKELLEVSELVQRDWDEVFFRACGLYTALDRTHYAQHGAMYIESGWPSAIGCSMLYHRDKREFAADFLRIYREFNFGENMPDLLVSENRINKTKDVNYDKESNLAFYKQFDSYQEVSIIDFLYQLDMENVLALSSLPVEDIDMLLQESSNELIDVKYCNFGEKGGALISSPLHSVWRVYDLIAAIAT